MKHLLIILLLFSFGLSANSQKQLGFTSPGDTSMVSITTKLIIPFGTIAKLEVEIYDGDSLLMKGYEGTYLLKVNSVNNKTINDTLLLTFTDETGEIANDNFTLFKLTYNKAAKSLKSRQIPK